MQLSDIDIAVLNDYLNRQGGLSVSLSAINSKLNDYIVSITPVDVVASPEVPADEVPTEAPVEEAPVDAPVAE